MISREKRDYSALTVKYAIYVLPTIIELNYWYFSRSIFSGKHGGKEHASSVKKEVLFRRIIQKEVLSKSSQKYKSVRLVFVLWIVKIKRAFLVLR